MRHRKAGRHLARTSAHRLAMRRNLAQSLFQFDEIRTTLVKAKDVRPFVERLITLARTDSPQSRQRVAAILGDRALIPRENQEAYEEMPDAHRRKVLFSRSGRRHTTGTVPPAYNKKKFTFVASSIVRRLFTEIAPRFKDRPGGYTRIVPLADHRIGDNSRLAILQLVGSETAPPSGLRRPAAGRRKQKAERRVAFAEGRIKSRRTAQPSGDAAAGAAGAEVPTPPPEEKA